MKSLRVYYRYVKMPRCWCVEHGLEYITFYVQKHIAHLAACSGSPLVRDRPLRAPPFVKLADWRVCWIISFNVLPLELLLLLTDTTLQGWLVLFGHRTYTTSPYQLSQVSCWWHDNISSCRADSWWHYQMGKFSALLALCEGNPLVIGGFPSQRPVTWSLGFFFDLCLNKRLSKQSRRWWFETPFRSLWGQCIVLIWFMSITPEHPQVQG